MPYFLRKESFAWATIASKTSFKVDVFDKDLFVKPKDTVYSFCPEAVICITVTSMHASVSVYLLIFFESSKPNASLSNDTEILLGDFGEDLNPILPSQTKAIISSFMDG